MVTSTKNRSDQRLSVDHRDSESDHTEEPFPDHKISIGWDLAQQEYGESPYTSDDMSSREPRTRATRRQRRQAGSERPIDTESTKGSKVLPHSAKITTRTLGISLLLLFVLVELSVNVGLHAKHSKQISVLTTRDLVNQERMAQIEIDIASQNRQLGDFLIPDGQNGTRRLSGNLELDGTLSVRGSGFFGKAVQAEMNF